MDVTCNPTKLLVFFIAGILAKEKFELEVTSSPQTLKCNNTDLRLKIQECVGYFKTDMAELDPQKWCNLTHFIGQYDYFTTCSESNAKKIGCYWPHPMVEHYIILIHKQFFYNCTYTPITRTDIPALTLYILITVSVFFTLVTVALVVGYSKQR